MTSTLRRLVRAAQLALPMLALSAGASLAAPATALPYNYIDIDLVSVDSGDGSDSGLSVDGSYAFSDMFYGVASISDIDPVTTLSAGAGLHGALAPRLHIFGELQFLSVDAGAGSDTGYMLSGGLRGEATPQLELYGRVDHIDIFGGTDDSLTIGGVFYLDAVGIQAAFTSNDTADAVSVGVRFSF